MAVRYYLLYRLPRRADLIAAKPDLHPALFICEWSVLLRLLPTGRYRKSGCLVKGFDGLDAALAGVHDLCHMAGDYELVGMEIPVYTPPMVDYFVATERMEPWWQPAVTR